MFQQLQKNSQNLCVFLWWTGIWRRLPCPASWLTRHSWVCLKGGEHLDPGETPHPPWVLAVSHRMHTWLSPALYQIFHLYWLRDVWLHYMPTKLPSLKLPWWCKRPLTLSSNYALVWPVRALREFMFRQTSKVSSQQGMVPLQYRTQLQFALCDVHCSLEMQCCPRWTTAVLHPALSTVTKATQPLPMAWQKNKLNLQNENMVMLWDIERAKCLLDNFKIALEEINF